MIELSCVPMRTEEAQFHDYNRKGRVAYPFQSSCIIPDCNGSPSTSCVGCTRDVRGIVFVCRPSTGRQCWKILHQARAVNPVDDQGNAIERPSLIKKRKRNSSFGIERVAKRHRKSLALNPHHAQLEWKHLMFALRRDMFTICIFLSTHI